LNQLLLHSSSLLTPAILQRHESLWILNDHLIGNIFANGIKKPLDCRVWTPMTLFSMDPGLRELNQCKSEFFAEDDLGIHP